MIDRRQEIIIRSREMFSQKSFHAVSMEDISRSLGMGKSTMYHYFSTKQELWNAVIKDTIAGLYNSVANEINANDPYEKQIYLLVSSTLTYFEENRNDFLLLLREKMDFLDLEAIKKQLDVEFWTEYGRFVDHFRDMIMAGQAEGLFVPVDPSLILANIFGTINAVVLAVVVTNPTQDLTGLIDGCYQVITSGIFVSGSINTHSD